MDGQCGSNRWVLVVSTGAGLQPLLEIEERQKVVMIGRLPFLEGDDSIPRDKSMQLRALLLRCPELHPKVLLTGNTPVTAGSLILACCLAH